MDKRKKHIEEEVRKTIGMADRIRNVEGNPFLATRVLQQIENEKSSDVGIFNAITPVYKVAFSVVLIALNALVFLQTDGIKPNSAQATESTINIANEYGLVVEDSYELSYSYLLEK